ncbi:hypothetical protein CC80DRAFT_64073 [Byssothecium circinans]|uniref:Uncharacterized protein n=1 Tax=Byssothecium circinans TaxID=147558 RepID=A0A6A5TXC0_9PLEO|nr:hypothetical protein CC80DRAFT_64073 [Byssothecium circinans]
MSGNPFRASLHLQPNPTASASASPTNTQDSRALEARDHGRDTVAVHDASSTTPAKTKKSVRIESPIETIPPHPAFHDVDSPLPPVSPQRVSYAQHLGSPPIVSPAGFSDNFEDFEVDGTGGGIGEADARGMTAGSKKNSGTLEAVLSPSGAPSNPFARTLATIEPQEKGSGELMGQNKDRTSTERTQAGAAKASLDVEGFKNLLMTGITSPGSSGPPPQNAPAPKSINAAVFESSSSTDTSSVSRQSIFEPVHDTHSESPRTSYEMVASDDERASLMGEQNKKKEKKKPPPAPKSRHGKLVNAKGPQTVSFEDFAATNPTASSLPAVRAGRSNSDLNKPLPPTPPVPSPQTHITSQDNTQDFPSIPDSRSSDTASLSDAAPAQKRVPPPVPLARRHSQLRNSTVGNRSRSNSSLTISSQHSIELPTLSPNLEGQPTSSPSSSQKIPPPPPPTRHRGAALATISTSSANSSSTELSSTAAAARRPTITSPNIPSSRRTTLSSEPTSPAAGLARASSINSVRTSHRAVSNESASSSNIPPPPPPPRRRQSGRSSIDKERPMPSSPTENSRISTEYKRSSPDSKRRTSVASESSLKYEYAPTSTADGGEHALYSPKEGGEERSGTEDKSKRMTATASILDDMDKFQKEIEELRAKYRTAA